MQYFHGLSGHETAHLTVLEDYTNGVHRTTASMEAQSLKRC